MPERFGQVKDICDKRICSVVFDLPNDFEHLTIQHVVNATTFRRSSPDVFDHKVVSKVCKLPD